MAITNLNISYPDFTLGEVIDPEQFDLNNLETVNKINTIISVLNTITDSITDGGSGADSISLTAIAPFASTKLQVFLEDVITMLRGTGGSAFIGAGTIAGVTGATVHAQLGSLKSLIDALTTSLNAEKAKIVTLQAHASNTNNPHAVTASQVGTYTASQIDTKDTAITTALNMHKGSSDHDTRYYTKGEIDGRLRGGDTLIKMEVFQIITSNNGDNTFTYRDGGGTDRTGTLTPEGYQTFFLLLGQYPVGENRIEAVVGDTLHRSAVSGGLVETSSTAFTLTSPEAAGAEITVKYFERLGITGEHALSHQVGNVDEVPGLFYMGAAQPASTKAFWFKVVG
jgi:hypothetical protein